jgi:vacuolar-type H+-ATPase subunit F/Vma7
MKVVFIGDELTAAGFRLTGIATHTPPAEGRTTAISEAAQGTSLLVVAGEYAAAVPMKDAGAAGPLVAVIPDIRGHVGPADLAGKLRRTLGIET